MALFFSCASQEKRDNSPAAGSDAFAFNVTVVNKTHFDLEIVDGTRIIPHDGEKLISLPAFFGELHDGYRVVYRVKLLDDIFIRVPRNENIIINNNQETALVESPGFYTDASFLILKNEGKQTISLKRDNEYLNSLVQGDPQKYGSPYLTPGSRQVYELKPGGNDLSIETDQYRLIKFPLTNAAPGYRYSFVFNGSEAVITDARPLTRIGEPEPVTVEFAGDAMPRTDKEKLIAELENSFKRYQVPLRITDSAESTHGEPLVRYTLILTLNTQVQPSRPPANMELIRGEISITLLRNGLTIGQAGKKNITEMNRDGVLRVVTNLIQENADFYRRLIVDMSR
jgi:hypothetical protein